LPPLLRQQLLDLYIERLGDFGGIGREAFLHYFYAYVYVRILQALGLMDFAGFTSARRIFAERAVRAEESALAAAT